MRFIFERLRDRVEVQFSELFFISPIIGLCENASHEKLTIIPFESREFLLHQKGFVRVVFVTISTDHLLTCFCCSAVLWV